MKLSTILPIDVVKQSKKLQGIETDKYWGDHEDGMWVVCLHFDGEKDPILKTDRELKEDEDGGFYPAPSLSDVIDNAEELFGDLDVGGYDNPPRYMNIECSNKIIEMCYKGKPLEEISKYILDNIK